MPEGHAAPREVEVIGNAVLALTRTDAVNLTARELAIFLICYLNDEPQAVRSLVAELMVSPSAVTRAANRLEMLGLTRRRRDPADGRGVLLTRTHKGSMLLRELKLIMRRAADAAATGQPSACAAPDQPAQERHTLA